MKTKYAVCACLNLARHADRPSMIIAEISQEGNLPQKFLESILQDLRRGGLVHSRKGRHGGYSLVKPPRNISLGEILRLTGSLRSEDGFSRRIAASEDMPPGLGETHVEALLAGVRRDVMRVLDDTTLQDMLDSWESSRPTPVSDWVI